MEKLVSYLSELKNGEKFEKFISKCWLVLPQDLSILIEKHQVFVEFAKQLSEVISSNEHMLPITAEEIIAAFLERQSYFIN